MNRNDKEFLVEKIRTQYTEKQPSELDELKALDGKVRRPATVFAYTFGSLSAIVMGAGMSLVMTEIGAVLGLAASLSLPVGIAVGAVGLILSLVTYPIYRGILNARKKKYAPAVLALSDKLMRGN